MNNLTILNKLEEEYLKLSDETKVALNKWAKSLNESNEYNYNHTSYGLKHYFENDITLLGKPYCVTNDQFKFAMFINKFEPDDYEEENWCFKISEKQHFDW